MVDTVECSLEDDGQNSNDTTENMTRSSKGEHRNTLHDSSEWFRDDVRDESTEIWWFGDFMG